MSGQQILDKVVDVEKKISKELHDLTMAITGMQTQLATNITKVSDLEVIIRKIETHLGLSTTAPSGATTKTTASAGGCCIKVTGRQVTGDNDRPDNDKCL